jgi:hypothetical protein
LELAEEVGAHLPLTACNGLCKPDLGKMTEAGCLEGIRSITEVPKRAVAGRREQSSFESPVERCDTIRREFGLFLVLDLLERAWTELPGQGALRCLTQSASDEFTWENQFLAGTQSATHNDVGVWMVRIVMDNSAPLDFVANLILNACNYILHGPVKTRLPVLWGDDDLEKSFVAGFLPLPCNSAEGTLFCQTELLFALALALALRTFSLNIATVRFPSARSAGTGIANIDDSAALEC